VLDILEDMGWSKCETLKDTGICLSSLGEPDYCVTIEGEFSLYRNILKLTEDPCIGLTIGNRIPLETYGIYGYALLCSGTLRDYVKISAEYGVLSLTHFTFSTEESSEVLTYKLVPSYPIPDDLLRIFVDRDMSAGLSTIRKLGARGRMHKEVHLPHDGLPDTKVYEDYYRAPVKFNQPYTASIVFQSALDQPLNSPDPEVMEACLVQCRELLNKVALGVGTKARVTEMLISARGRFLSIEEIAAKMGCSSRTLRRSLRSEGGSYAQILKDVRLNLAKEYLASGLKLETVGDMLGYSEAAAFSRAFKQWTSVSPKVFRESLRAGEI